MKFKELTLSSCYRFQFIPVLQITAVHKPHAYVSIPYLLLNMLIFSSSYT